MTALYLSTSSCGVRPSSSARTRIGVPCSSVPLTMRTSCPAIRMYRLNTSEGTPKPATWPMWRGPLVYGQATADRTRVMSASLVTGRHPVSPGGVRDQVGRPGGSAEVEVAGARALQLVEVGELRDGDRAVPQLTGLLAARDLGEDGAEERGPVDVDGRGADVVTDGVHALMVALGDGVVERRVVPGLDQVGREADVGQRRGDGLLRELLAVVVAPGADGGVPVAEGLVVVVLGDLDRDADGLLGALQHLAVAVGDVLVLVEVGQRHHVPLHVDVTDLLDLADPARGDPGERAERVEPEVSGSHVHNNSPRRPPIRHRSGFRHTPVAGCPHAWPQSRPGRTPPPRRPPARNAVHGRPGPEITHPAR